jgi:hypothetical protein
VGRLLFDPQNSSLIAKQMVAITLAHELASFFFSCSYTLLKSLCKMFFFQIIKNIKKIGPPMVRQYCHDGMVDSFVVE